jgi:DNA-binding transcriptional LysR family regulator
MKINSNRLNAFYHVAIHRNFHRAADHLYITQSALSQRILKLEQEVGVILFIRTLRGVDLTPAGNILFEYARNFKADEQAMLTLISEQSISEQIIELKFAAYSSILRSAIMPALKILIAQTDKVRVEFSSRELRELPYMLENTEVDFIVLDHVLKNDHFLEVPLGKETLVHIRPKHKSESVLPFLDHDIDDQTTFSFFKRLNINNNVTNRLFYDDIYGILDGVKMGVGQAIVSKHLVSGLDGYEIVHYDHEVSNPIVLYYHKRSYLSKFHQAVIAALTKNTPIYLA